MEDQNKTVQPVTPEAAPAATPVTEPTPVETPVTEPATPVTPPPAAKSGSKLPLVLLAILLLLALASGAAAYMYFANQDANDDSVDPTPTPTVTTTETPSPTDAEDELDTYTSEKLGVTFEYPKDWDLEEEYRGPNDPAGHVGTIVYELSPGNQVFYLSDNGEEGYSGEVCGEVIDDQSLPEAVTSDITINNKVEELITCETDGVVTSLFVDVQGSNINEWYGFFVNINISDEIDEDTAIKVLESIKY